MESGPASSRELLSFSILCMRRNYYNNRPLRAKGMYMYALCRGGALFCELRDPALRMAGKSGTAIAGLAGPSTPPLILPLCDKRDCVYS